MPFGVHLGQPTSASATGDVGVMPPDNALLTVGQPIVWKLAVRDAEAEAAPGQ